MNRKKIFKLFASLFIVCISGLACANDEKDVRKIIEATGGAEKFISKLAQSQVKNLPQQIDSETKIISMYATGLTLHITHKFINASTRDDMSKNGIEDFVKFQTTKVCTSVYGKVLINEQGVRYRYQYLGKAGNSIFTFDVTKEKCAQLK